VNPVAFALSVLCGLLALSACNSVSHVPVVTPHDADAEVIKENCALARERENEAAIAHWCKGL